ncbi:nickel pincer cofactor biosynthesis protein LarC [Planctomicrobium sp. SH664]|uniref:nickel pincer cofactor biosynthesis protein LarC n=1 Tax=Planctomicrobium sp. SH664 TaxID=3448125 RepID=UPI003F5B408C
MKILYLECATGISGDMLLAALIDAGVDAEAIRRGIASLQLPEVTLEVHEVMKSCFRAKSIRVVHPEQHAHRHYSDIRALLERAEGLTPRQRQTALEIFRAVAIAEAHVHGSDPESIHFHEVGAIDSIVDIVGAAIAFDLLQADQIVCGPLPPGRGEVRIDHGLCPVPTPGTAELLKGIPLRDLPIEAELTTPTGAAIVKVMADRFGPLPPLSIQAIGCGAGTYDLPDRANILRVFIGESVTGPGQDLVTLLETNLDSLSGEVIGYTTQQLLSAGALDVYSLPIQMKKQRPGILLSVLSPPALADKLEEILFAETGTLGIRRHLLERSVRARQPHTVLTSFGPLLGKVAWQSSGKPEFSPEFDDCARLAQIHNRPFREIYRAAMIAFEQLQPELQTQRPHPVVAPSAATGGHDHDHHGHRHDHDHNHSHDHDHHH